MIDTQQLAMSYELGMLKATYKPSIGYLLAATFGFAFAVIMLVIPLGAIAEALHYSTSVLPSLFFLILPMVPTGLAVYMFRKHRRASKLRVYVHEHGFIYVRGERVRAHRWDQIVSVQLKVTTSTHTTAQVSGDAPSTTYSTANYKYMLQCQDGSMLTLDGTFARIEKLGKTIEVESARYLIPAAQNVLNEGQIVTFGVFRVDRSSALQVDRSGCTWIPANQFQIENEFRAGLPVTALFEKIHVDQLGSVWVKRILWQEVTRVEINEEMESIVIYRRPGPSRDAYINVFGTPRSIHVRAQDGSWVGVSTGTLPNFELLKAVIRPYVQV
ncbi:MAG: hypothetical protein J2P37_08660 [Ktedonobacteraceae bacterium]|nr:hypothetical protein [Ktedonobacteraceae bacterium]MBO0796288.1 hypothetical protein [Ktedonobacteraceae bacterium]